jgi:hypothetical protein
VNEDARRHLLMLVDFARSGPHGRQSGEEWKRECLSRFGAALEALRAVGALTQEETEDWNNRLLVALGIQPLEPLPTGSRGTVARAIRVSDAPPPLVIVRPTPRFLRLMPARVPDVAIGFGGRLQILGVELYDTQVAVTWRLAPLPDPELQFKDQLAAHDLDSEGLPEHVREQSRRMLVQRLGRPGQRLSLSDDAGTEYHHAGGSSGGGSEERIGRSEFTPAVPNNASELLVHWQDEVTIPIDLHRGR